MKTKLIPSLLLLAGTLLSGCVTAPHEVVLLHEKETALMQDLRRIHSAMIDSYMDQKIAEFDRFYFNNYGPAYRTNYLAAFKKNNGRDFDESRDFSLFYNDLVAKYQLTIAPLEKLRADLRESIRIAYEQAAQANESIGNWIRSVERLNQAERGSLDKLLKMISPSFSIDRIDSEVKRLQQELVTANKI